MKYFTKEAGIGVWTTNQILSQDNSDIRAKIAAWKSRAKKEGLIKESFIAANPYHIHNQYERSVAAKTVNIANSAVVGTAVGAASVGVAGAVGMRYLGAYDKGADLLAGAVEPVFKITEKVKGYSAMDKIPSKVLTSSWKGQEYLNRLPGRAPKLKGSLSAKFMLPHLILAGGVLGGITGVVKSIKKNER